MTLLLLTRLVGLLNCIGKNMPVIRVVRLESDPESEFPAAAVMARMLASAAKPIREVPPNHSRIERTLPGNPNGLTVEQHVFPLCSMQAFVGPVKRVSLFEMSEGKSRRVKPKNVVFCAERAWDQRTEGVLMKQIEDEFQDIVQPILRGQAHSIAPEQKHAIDRMFALWYMRSRHRNLEAQEIQLNSVSGSALTKTEEENLEMNNYMYIRPGGKMPARQFNGMRLQQLINDYTRDLDVLTGWGAFMPDPASSSCRTFQGTRSSHSLRTCPYSVSTGRNDR
ncbi:hypothetical protein [Caballeronia sp. SBC1]|uniref:hypothetical protein n=1 Tax=Caballeronia sp. SBC1 TaxID=2705548 RepID=UPI0014079B50|nr:hypothetical protein [Caballeronia sp. SBC1]